MSEERLIGICSNPHSEQMWWEADSTKDRCPMECDCEPRFFVPASHADSLERELRGQWQRAERAETDAIRWGRRWEKAERENERLERLLTEALDAMENIRQGTLVAHRELAARIRSQIEGKGEGVDYDRHRARHEAWLAEKQIEGSNDG